MITCQLVLVLEISDDKENARLILSQIVLDAFATLKMSYPTTTSKREEELKTIRELLEAESPSKSKRKSKKG